MWKTRYARGSILEFGTGSRSLFPLPVPPHRQLPALDRRATQRGNHIIRHIGGDLHQGVAFVDADGAGLVAAQTCFIRDGADQVLRPDAGRPARADEDVRGFLVAAPASWRTAARFTWPAA